LQKSPWGLADRTWLEATARRYGVGSLYYRSHVLAEIPAIDADVLIPEAWLDFAASTRRPTLPPGHWTEKTRRISVDLGEGVGRDSSAVLVRDDLGILEVIWGPALGLGEAAEAVYRMAAKWRVPGERISYDRVGIGRDFHHHLTARGLVAVGYAGDGGARSRDFTNIRTEAAWLLRQRLDPHYAPDPSCLSATQPPFTIPAGPYWARMREELKAMTYDLRTGKIRLILKADLVTKLGHSPDLADALIQSFAF